MQQASLYHQLLFKEKAPAISVLLDTAFTKEIRILFRKGQEMKEHKTNYPIVVHVVQGAILFGVNDNTYALKEGDMITLNPLVPHHLQAETDSIVRLTLYKADTAERVLTAAEQ